jgi:hypothetical protein
LDRNFHSLVKNFTFEGEFIDAAPYGFGHINDTYALNFEIGSHTQRRYILQRINHNVFKDPVGVMHNLERVTRHLQVKIENLGGDPLRETINLIPTIDGLSYYQDADGDYWRGEVFIEGAQTYQIPKDPAHYYNAAWAFGRFSSLLADFPVNELAITIPDFHHTPKRFKNFSKALEIDPKKRVQQVQSEIEFLLNREAETSVLVHLSESGQLPVRVTHNDTKFENVMIDDRSGQGICVIDLDTVMPGLINFDFGDAVRSGSNPAAEDEVNLDKVRFDIEIFEHLAHGYLAAAGDMLTPIELQNLAFAARLITLEQALRFLTDHLLGDVYYRIHRPDHNLDRCRTQIKLIQEMEAVYDQMVNIVNSYRETLQV